jgi:maleylpyruvate isomerase
MFKLYSYFRSSASYRVRIALNLKGLPYEVIPVHLLRDGGDQHQPHFIDNNPARLVPVLEHGPLKLTQSVAIIEFLDDVQPAPPLLPREPLARAQVRAFALDIACEVHPLNNLRVLQYLKTTFALDEAARAKWSYEWIDRGFMAIESKLSSKRAEAFCFGNVPTLADCCLVPQVFNALRINFRLERYASIKRVYENCMGTEAFQNAAPGCQIDAE